MKYLFVASALVIILSASAATATPMCDGPNFEQTNGKGVPIYSEDEEARIAEQKLRGMGIDANNTRFWNGCIQTFVTDESGHTKMRFYDPNTYAEVPAN